MARRRWVVSSDDDDEDPRLIRGSPGSCEERRRKPGKKTLRFDEEEEEEETASAEGNTYGEEKSESVKLSRRTRRGRWGEAQQEADEREEDGEEEEEDPIEDARPIGDVTGVCGKGQGRKYHFRSFEYDGNVFELEDPVLITPEDVLKKPYVAIIKDIVQNVEGSMYIIGQWFYRPEEAEKKGGGHWNPRDIREIFYSFHLDLVPAECVMHKCVVHFIPLHKKLPLSRQLPGFIVQMVYDTVCKSLWKLTDKDYEDSIQHEIDVLLQKTRDSIGELPDVELEECTNDQADELLNKQNLKKKPVHAVDVSRTDETLMKHDNSKAETPGSQRWSGKLLHGMKVTCNQREDAKLDKRKLGDDSTLEKMYGNKQSEVAAATKTSGSNDGEQVLATQWSWKRCT